MDSIFGVKTFLYISIDCGDEKFKVTVYILGRFLLVQLEYSCVIGGFRRRHPKTAFRAARGAFVEIRRPSDVGQFGFDKNR